MTRFRMYGELAPWWPLLSAPADYAEEAEFYRSHLVAACRHPARSLLELGSGGGNNASHMKGAFDEVTLVDLSPAMLRVSEDLNPDCRHVEGDMRTVRLGRTFDCVFVHDAVGYMTTKADLRAVVRTAREHCMPGGAALFAPDHVTENFRAATGHGGHDGDGQALRYLQWTWDPGPDNTTAVTDYVFLLRDAAGQVTSIHERHTFGLFPRATWFALLEEAGFRVTVEPFAHSDVDYVLETFVGVAPEG